MAWYDKVLPTVAAIAPAIATGLGGPLAGLAVNALFTSLGVATEEEAQQALININPETAAKVRAADQQFALDMERLGVDLEKIDAEDRASARKREMEVKDKTPAMIGAFILLGFFSALVMLAVHEVPGENKEAFFILLGALSASLTSLIQYYYGSSTSSRQKDASAAAVAATLAEKK